MIKADIDLSGFASVGELAAMLEQQSPEAAARVRECASLDEVRQLLDIQAQIAYQKVFSPGHFTGHGTYSPPQSEPSQQSKE